METINFSDIFKSSFLETTSSFSLMDSLLGLSTAFVIGLFIYMIYKKTFSGVIYSHSFNISLIVMAMATALIIIGISTNVLLSLGMVGALSIVRFRTPIKDPMDIVYLFWTIVSGILCGAGFLVLAMFGSLMIGLVLVVFMNRIKVENPYLLIVKYDDEEVETPLAHIIASSVKKHTVKSKSVFGGNEYEVTYEVRVKDAHLHFMKAISDMAGVKSAVMLSYDGNFTA